MRNPQDEFRVMSQKAECRYTGAVFGFKQRFPKMGRKLSYYMTPKDVHDFFMNALRETIAYREASNVTISWLC